jgi:hypothetical protein
MSTDILALLVTERDKLNLAIAALQGSRVSPGRPSASISVTADPGVVRQRRKRTPAERKAQGERMKAYWAARRKKQGKA